MGRYVPPEIGDQWQRLSDERVFRIQKLSAHSAQGIWLEDRIDTIDPKDEKGVKTIKVTRHECAGNVLTRSLANPERFRFLG